MAFTLEVQFSGLCHFIPNAAPNDHNVKMCVALPEAAGHEAAIKVGEGVATDVETGRSVEEVPIRQPRRIFWNVSPATAGGGWSWSPFRVETGYLVHLAVPLDQLAPTFADEDLAVVGARRAQYVRAQVLLDRGHLVPEIAGARAQWRLPGLVGQAPDPIWVRNTAVLTIPGVDTAQLVLANFANDSRRTLSLTPVNDRVSLFLSNDCARNVAFPLPVSVEGRIGTVDLDFFYHYSLLRPSRFASLSRPGVNVPYPQLAAVVGLQEELDDLRSGRSLTREEKIRLELLEIKERRGITAGAGCNCLGAIGKARLIELDPFLG